jgi:hypothetical protein
MARGRPAVDPSDRAQHLALGSRATTVDFARAEPTDTGNVMLEIRTSRG